MTETGDPWREIEVPKEDNTLNVRRADVRHSLDYWFARDFLGRYVLCFDTTGKVPVESAIPKLAGIDVNMLPFSDASCRLVLTLLESEQLDIFRALCFDLMRSTAALTEDERGGRAFDYAQPITPLAGPAGESA